MHHIYGASERRLDELAHRIHFAFAKRIFAVGEISRNGAYYTYFIFSTACIIYTELLRGGSMSLLIESTSHSRSESSPQAKYPEMMHTIHICFFKLPRYFITFALSCQGFLKKKFYICLKLVFLYKKSRSVGVLPFSHVIPSLRDFYIYFVIISALIRSEFVELIFIASNSAFVPL